MKQWTESTARWVIQPFESIEIDEILTTCQQVSKTLLTCERNLPSSSALIYLKQLCFDFKDTMPIVESLSNKNLEPFHWEQIRVVIDNRTFPLEEKCFELGELIELNISKYQDAIVHISVTATQESKIKTQFDQLFNHWQKMEFEILQYKSRDNYKIGGFEYLNQQIEESMSLIGVLSSS